MFVSSAVAVDDSWIAVHLEKSPGDILLRFLRDVVHFADPRCGPREFDVLC